MSVKISRALVSVSDKSGIVEFCRFLIRSGVEILSTGGTAALLSENGLEVVEVSDYTGFPEMMDGRVKTLHPKVHGGLLGRRGTDDEVMAEHGIQPIDLVVVNLYPFQQTVAKPGCSLENAIENIDIGGPTMIRAAAKNHTSVGVVVDPADYASISRELEAEGGCLSDQTRFRLAVKCFDHTASYDTAIAAYLNSTRENDFPQTLNLQFGQGETMRYGENPHQQAAFYREPNALPGTISSASTIQGKALSYNNIADTDAALECVKQFNQRPACVIVKHANPCGVAEADSLLGAYDLAHQTDPTSAFGGIIAFNRELDAATASEILKRQFVEVVIAPSVAADAAEVLAGKPNVRLLAAGEWTLPPLPCRDFKRVAGGLLVQDLDVAAVSADDVRVVSERIPADDELQDMLFAWKVVKFVKSNAIVYSRNRQTVGIGAGQMSRVYSARIAGIKAADEGLEVQGAVMASDAFFPFRDGIDSAAETGIKAVIQPGGSMRDDEIIAAANEHGIAMVFTGIRHFRH